MKLLIASTNKGKLKEIREILEREHLPVDVISPDSEFPEIDETGTTFKENALLKARTAYSLFNIPVLADDSGLCVAALGGAPGIYSARYAGEPVNPDRNIDKLLSELSTEKEPLTAHFNSTLAFINGTDEFVFEGLLKGQIIRERRGKNGFGYDPVFIPDGYSETLGELHSDIKNSISHRKQSLNQFVAFLKQYKGLL